LRFLLLLKYCLCSDINLAGVEPKYKPVKSETTGRGVRLSIVLAFLYIRKLQWILRKYIRLLKWKDLQCNAAVGVKAFFDMMHIGPHKVMLFGAACTQVTDPIAKASRRWHLTQRILTVLRLPHDPLARSQCLQRLFSLCLRNVLWCIIGSVNSSVLYWLSSCSLWRFAQRGNFYIALQGPYSCMVLPGLIDSCHVPLFAEETEEPVEEFCISALHLLS
ncbi:hypothetical protein L9F63_023029, partial [Diploptera punctata]